MTDQTYIVSDVYSDYTVPVFSESQASGCTTTYTNAISPSNAWMTDSGGSGRVLGWHTADEVEMGNYVVTITATSGNFCFTTTNSDSYTLTVTDPCEIAPIVIDNGDSIFLAGGTHTLTIDAY